MITSESAPGYVRLAGSKPTSVPVTIANGASLAAFVDLDTKTLVGIHMPAAWDTANLTFQVSEDGVTYDNLYDSAGIEKTITVAASRYISVTPAEWVGVRFLKVRSGTSGTAVNQTAARTIQLITKAV